ncbi:imidazolonepropionase [Deinococcus radiophilus]|uniref:Imidazolonepropionase n=1 Tax=Deinococcus radiophilus TaxID=32062 RepID=A0A3S0RD12_9DEIO|nr:imidazolonepropionase [Deinococcus radiophilus]RTR25359.1 imidazolonepropionase [Deinococcus radiophilus]UFA51647.1 imidazolonepropionase [Deinococcus radiophilus]
MTETLFTDISQLATPASGLQRGAAMRGLSVTENAALLVRDGVIAWTGQAADAPQAEQTISLGGRAVVPGLVDPHTHAVWAGDRLADWDAKLSGATYEEILARGGGIRSTMRATAAATVDELVALARPRLAALRCSGATTIEVKSGYGLDPEAELRMLRAVRELRREFDLSPTLLIHVPPETGRAEYVQEVCRHLIPQAAEMGLANAVDVFTEKEAFTVEETRALLEAAQSTGLHTKLHADQFHAIGGTELACELGALSVDHLEASGPEQIAALAASDTVATILPGVTLHLGLPAAPGRKLIDAGAAVAIGTDLNPGSSPLFSTQFALALGVRLCGLTPAEALTACTVNAAAALGLTDRGSLSKGQRADFCVLEGADWREVAYVLGGNVVAEVWCGGVRATAIRE